MDEIQSARLEIMHIASRSCGEDVSYKYVLEAAQAYLEFVIGKRKTNLRVVKNEPEDDEVG